MKPLLSLIILSLSLYAQDPSVFSGSLSFEFSGLGGSGSFSADFEEDTTSAAGAALWTDADTTYMLVSAFKAESDSTLDVFLMMLRDTSGSGITNQNLGIFNPTDPFPSMILMEDMDTSLAASFIDLVPDSAELTDLDSTELFTDSLFAEIVGLLISNAYINVSGAITFTSSDSDSVAGSFSGILTPTNPFYARTISNGQFNLYPVEIPIELSVENKAVLFPLDFELTALYPNPFNPAVTLEFSVNQPSLLALNIYNLKGEAVESLFEAVYTPGIHSASWVPADMPSGVYIAALSSYNSVVSRKILYIK